MRIAMQCHPSLYYVMFLGKLLSAVQFNVFISLWFLLILLIKKLPKLSLRYLQDSHLSYFLELVEEARREMNL